MSVLVHETNRCHQQIISKKIHFPKDSNMVHKSYRLLFYIMLIRCFYSLKFESGKVHLPL